jgi:hypothetical protein
MNRERKPACDALLLSGSGTASGNKTKSTEQNDKDILVGAQQYLLPKVNNKAKSSYKRPDFFNSEQFKKRPHCIMESGRVIDSILKYKDTSAAERKLFTQPEKNDYLKVLDLFVNPRLSELLYHQDKTTKQGKRKRRRERVEALIPLVLKTLLFYTDLQRMALGVYDNRNHFHYFDYNFISEKSGIPYCRVKRAMSVLQELNLVSVHRIQQTLNDGYIINKEVRIDLSPEVYELLGLENEFLKSRSQRSEKFLQKQARLLRSEKSGLLPRLSKVLARNYKNPIQGAQLDLKHYSHQSPNLIKNRGPAQTCSRGMAIKEHYSQLIGNGYSPSEAARLIKEKFDPPS